MASGHGYVYKIFNAIGGSFNRKKFFLQFYHNGRTIKIEKSPKAQWEKGLWGLKASI
jgi:hypothetical protein